MTIKNLKPELVFDIFDQITKVPRPSKKEGKIRQFLLDFAEKHGIAVKTGDVKTRHSRPRISTYCHNAVAYGHGVRVQRQIIRL